MYSTFLHMVTLNFYVIYPIRFPQRRHLSCHTSIAVGMMTVLLSLYVLGLGVVGWIPLSLTCTHIKAAIPTVTTGPVTLPSAVSPLPYVTVAVSSAYMLLLWPPV